MCCCVLFVCFVVCGGGVCVVWWCGVVVRCVFKIFVGTSKIGRSRVPIEIGEKVKIDFRLRVSGMSASVTDMGTHRRFVFLENNHTCSQSVVRDDEEDVSGPDGHEDEEVTETPEDACLDEIATNTRDSCSVGTESVIRKNHQSTHANARPSTSMVGRKSGRKNRHSSRLFFQKNEATG